MHTSPAPSQAIADLHRRLALIAVILVLVGSGCAMSAPPSPTLEHSPTAIPPSESFAVTPEAAPTSVSIVSAEPFAPGEATCQNEAQGYAVSYPADWTVAPADPEQEIAACHYFGPGPLDLDFSDGEGVPPTIDIGAAAGGCLEADSGFWPVKIEEVSVAGYPAVRLETELGGYAYVLNLRSDDGPVFVEPNDPTPPTSEECLGARWLMIAARDYGAIDGPPLERIVDRMAATIEILDD